MKLRIGAALALALLLAPAARAACCYFAAKDKDINQPGQKAFLTWDPEKKVESFTVQPKFEGNALDFGMVIPTPSRPKLDEMPRDLFKDLAIYTILLPLPEAIHPEPLVMDGMMFGAKPEEAPTTEPSVTVKKAVVVLESGVVGSLDYKIIVAEDAKALYAWLDENHYNYGGDVGTLDFYIAKKWFFTVMKIDSKQMKKAPDGSYLGEITPTRFTFASEACIYPLKITQLSVKSQTDALFYVQAPQQMDLQGDLSWKHSYRVMWLTYMLGCSASEEQQRELEARNKWVEAKRQKDPQFETTKLEWSRKLGDGEIGLLDDPLGKFAQASLAGLPQGAKVVELKAFLDEAKGALEKAKEKPDDVKARLDVLAEQYGPKKGAVVRVPDAAQRAYGSVWLFCANREAPDEDVKGLSRLKGHLQRGQWLTKFRKVLRKDEMTDDLVLLPVISGSEEEYVRIMPSSPP
jgi:hypothetical protein